MGNQHSAHGKYVLPNAGCVVSQNDASHAVVSHDHHHQHQPISTTELKSNKSSNIIKSSSSIFGAGKTGKNRSRKTSENSFENPTKNSRLSAQRQNSVPSPSKGAVRAVITTGSQVLLASQKMNCSIEKFAKLLIQLSGPEAHGCVSRTIFKKHVTPQSEVAAEYIWGFFSGYTGSETINEATFIHSAEQFYTPITDKDQVHFYVKVFGKGKDVVERNSFIDFLISVYQLSSSAASESSRGLNSTDDFNGKEWIEAITKACFHIKDEMSVYFLSNWILTNIPRILIAVHKYMLNQLTTGYAQLTIGTGVSGTQNTTLPSGISLSGQTTKPTELPVGGNTSACDKTETSTGKPGINPILLWLLSSSLPARFVAVLEQKPEQSIHPHALTSKQLLMQLLSTGTLESEKWSMLYHSDEQGLSINRFQFHVFNYRGPTLTFINSDDYTLCVASDTEWKESCHFWGGEDAVLLQLQPEFRIVERGTKMMYTNFSIRGYPFGIQVGKDPKNVSVEIKPDFEYCYFKKIPCRILSMVVWGCAPSPEKNAQAEFKKWEAKQCEKQRTINLNSVEWGDNPDKYLLELAGSYKSYGNH